MSFCISYYPQTSARFVKLLDIQSIKKSLLDIGLEDIDSITMADLTIGIISKECTLEQINEMSKLDYIYVEQIEPWMKFENIINEKNTLSNIVGKKFNKILKYNEITSKKELLDLLKHNYFETLNDNEITKGNNERLIMGWYYYETNIMPGFVSWIIENYPNDIVNYLHKSETVCCLIDEIKSRQQAANLKLINDVIEDLDALSAIDKFKEMADKLRKFRDE